MKRLFFFGACLVALASSPAMAQTAAPDVALVRFDRTGGGNLRIAITRGEGKTDVSEAKASYSKEGFTAVSEAEYKVLHQLYQEGYTLLHTTYEGSNAGMVWVFAKAH